MPSENEISSATGLEKPFFCEGFDLRKGQIVMMDYNSSGSTSTVEYEEVQATRKTLPPWNVVLLDDNDHTYEYVIGMLADLFGHPLPACFQMAQEVDASGRVVVFSTHRERAELERERIHGYGADPRIDRCKGSMSAIIEPAQGR